MRSLIFMASLGLAATLAGCQSLSGDMSLADYCANPNNGNDAVCRLKVDVDGNATTLADTNMSLSTARTVADSAASAASDAQAAADAAMSTANQAQATADSAMSLASEAGMSCKTDTIQKTNIGTCEPGYVVMGCTQTRYTTRAGRLSFLREINNEQCRFNSRVLEMQVRCCTADAAAMDTSEVAMN